MRSGPTKLFGTLMIFLKLCLKIIDFEKSEEYKKKTEKIPTVQRVNIDVYTV